MNTPTDLFAETTNAFAAKWAEDRASLPLPESYDYTLKVVAEAYFIAGAMWARARARAEKEANESAEVPAFEAWMAQD